MLMPSGGKLHSYYALAKSKQPAPVGLNIPGACVVSER